MGGIIERENYFKKVPALNKQTIIIIETNQDLYKPFWFSFSYFQPNLPSLRGKRRLCPSFKIFKVLQL